MGSLSIPYCSCISLQSRLGQKGRLSASEFGKRWASLVHLCRLKGTNLEWHVDAGQASGYWPSLLNIGNAAQNRVVEVVFLFSFFRQSQLGDVYSSAPFISVHSFFSLIPLSSLLKRQRCQFFEEFATPFEFRECIPYMLFCLKE